jgi:hypothetical protein
MAFSFIIYLEHLKLIFLKHCFLYKQRIPDDALCSNDTKFENLL